MTRPCVSYEVINGRTTKLYSYVVTLCKKGSDEVKAVRFDGYTSKYDGMFKADLAGNYSGWTVKSILKLYDEDFKEGE